jgi:DNA-binding NarL/FixJ family response regulator
MSDVRPRAVTVDLAPSVRSRLEQAGIDTTAAAAHDLLTEAEKIDAQLVVVSRRAALQALLEQPAEPMVAPERDVPRHGLSEREVDVLRLLATGKENTEIAQTLVISPKTVKNHVSRILSKLELRNRVEAAVFAVRHNLV